MEQTVIRDQRVLWAFWIAAALAAIGAVAPLSFSIGGHNRLQWVIVPFGIAAVSLGINAVMYHQGRSLAATLYFISGLAIVYGILAMVAVPLRLAVIGTCPPAPATCPLGFEPPMTSAENNGLGLASFCGVLAIFVGFYGLLMLYRRLGVRPRRGLLWPAKPPTQTAPAAVVTPPPAGPAPTPPVTAPAESPPVEAAPAEATPVVEAPAPAAPAAAAPRPARSRTRPQAKARPRVADEPKELEAPDEPKELPAPAEPKELPPPT
ncbi:MAG TPA: hypothetical protein VF956_04135 [Candidatus Dormibacteraeota bacterium]